MDRHQAKTRGRIEARERRRRLAAADARGVAAERLAEAAYSAVVKNGAARIAGYWPLADEIDPRPLLIRLVREGFAVGLPIVIGEKKPLAFHRWQPGDALRPGPFRVMQPEDRAPQLRPEMVLVPMLAFDREGYRLGYGGGYYDRTLAALAPMATLGLAFAGQEVEAVPREAHDMPLDGIATESGVLRCGEKGEPSIDRKDSA